MRIVLGFLLAPLLVAALLPITLEGIQGGFGWQAYRFALTGVYGCTLVLAVPLFLLLPAVRRRQLPILMSAAFVAATLGYWLVRLYDLPDFAQVEGTIIVANSNLTAAGWSHLASQSLLYGLIGSVGAILFWLISRSRQPD